MNDAIQTSVLGETPEISAPVRLKGQSNSDVLFNWLTVKRHLWMLQDPYEKELERIVGSRAILRLSFKLITWKRDPQHDENHEALAAPLDEKSRLEAFARLEKLLEVHFFGSGEASDG